MHIVCNKTKLCTCLYNVSHIIYTFIWYFSFFHVTHVTLITTPSWNLQVVVYLKLMEVYGHENGSGVFLWLVSNIKVLVTASYIMGKCWTGVFVSVFCNGRESMELLYDKECLLDNAVSLYYLEIPHFTLVGEPKVFKNNVKNIYSASPKLCIFFVLKLTCVRVCTMFPP